MKRILLTVLFFKLALIPAISQVAVKGIITEANTNPTSVVSKKSLPGVQVKAWGATAPDVSDNTGGFRLVFEGKKPGDAVVGVSLEKTGYEIFNSDVINSWKVSSDPNWVEKIKMCPAGTIARLSNENYLNLYNTLLTQFNNKKQEINKLKISDAVLSDTLKALEEKFHAQENKLQEYALRFARIDFDDVSDLYRKAYVLFSQGQLDSVAIVLEEADLMARTDLRLKERNRIEKVKTEVAMQERENEAGMKEDMEAIKMLAQTYTIKFEYEKATMMYDRLVQIDSLNVDNLLLSADFFGATKQYDRAISLSIRIINLPDALEWQKGNAYGQIATLQEEMGKFDDALKNYFECFTVYKDLSDKNPTVKLFKQNLAISYQFLGHIHQSMGHMEEALIYIENYYQLNKELYEANPRSEEMKKGLAISYQFLGHIHHSMGHMEEALKYFEEYNKLMKQLYEANLRSESLKDFLAISYQHLGEIHQSMGHSEEALKYFKNFNQFCKELYELNPQSEDIKNGLSISYEKLGDIHQSMGQMEEAIKHFEYRYKFSKELYDANPRNIELLESLAISYYKLAMVYKAVGNNTTAKQRFAEWKRIISFLVANVPQVSKYRDWDKVEF